MHADGEGGVGRSADHFKALRRAGDAVPVAHPHRILPAHFPEAVEQRAGLVDFDIGAAEFRRMAAFHFAAQLGAQGLLAIADRQDRQAAIDHRLRRARAAFIGHRSRPARQDYAFGLHPREGRLGGVERHDLGIDPRLADAPGDQLGDLAAEVDDEDGICGLDGHEEALRRGLAAVQMVTIC